MEAEGCQDILVLPLKVIILAINDSNWLQVMAFLLAYPEECSLPLQDTVHPWTYFEECS